jgi:RNA-directed DNA polymerase
MSLTTPLSVQKLQTALHDKAKGSPNFRFYALYDKVYREDVVAFAYDCCNANGGAAGVDGQTFEDIELPRNPHSPVSPILKDLHVSFGSD